MQSCGSEGNCDTLQPPPTHPDPTPSASSETPVTRSSDPNEIVGIDGWLFIANGDTLRWVSATQRLPYTIYFENDPEQATAAAQVVTIRMRLDPLMNMADFGIGTFGFGNHVFPVEGAPLQYQTRLDLTTEMNLYVDVVAGIDITTNEAFWIFSSIDPITGVAPTETDRGFLAVNDSTHIGEGYVTFSIKPKADLCHTGDTISAQASIVFDINDPIETNRWVNTIDAVPPVSTAKVVQETTDSLRIVFSGTDDTTGIAAYRLYYTEGRSAFRLAGRYQSGDTAVLEKNPNAQYTFFSIAEDNVGNLEPMKDNPDTLFGNTRVSLLASVTPAGAATIEGTGAYTQGDTVQLVLHPATGYHLSRWTEAGVSQGTDTLLSLVADQSHTLVAEMALQQYPLTVEAATGTTIEVTSHSQGAMTNSLSSVTYSDTLSIHLSSSPCYSDVAFFLNSQPISDDTIIIVHDSVHLTSTATAHIDTGYVHDTVCPGTAYIANGFNILSSSTTTPGILNFQFSILNLNDCDSLAVLSLVVRPSHTLTFLPNGGTGTMPAQHVCSGEAAVLNRATFTREGYYFAGWAATATATTPLYADGDVASFSNDQTLYAIWSSSCVDRVASRIVTACDSYSWGDSIYTASGEYMRTKSSVVPGGCDSVYRLHLTVRHSSENLQQVYACRQYTWIDGLTYTTDTTRQLSLTNAAGCDSLITLHLALGDDVTATETIVACDTLHWHNQTFTQSTTSATATIPSIYGCDSTITIHLTLNHSNTGTETVTACDNYTWHGTNYTASTNTPTYTETNAAGCDSVLMLNLTINNPVHIATTDTACENYTWNGTSYTTSGTYTFSHLDANGCTQVDTLHLTINNPVHLATTDTACETYTWNGTPYTASGNYTYTHLDANGCTQVDTLHLTIHNPVHLATTDTACETYTWNGTSYTTSGTYTYTHLDANGCTQVDTLHLTINYPVHLATTDTACETYTWNGTTYTASGIYTYTHLDANGCTQLDTLHLTINYPLHTATTDTACETYTWNGTPYTTSGIYTYTHLDANGCTQVDTLHLTINYPVHLATTDTACETYTWNGTPYTVSGTYTYTHLDANGCTQVDTLHLTINNPVHLATTDTACEIYTWNGTPYTASGTYTYSHLDANGCTQLDTLHLTINNPVHIATTDTACETYTWNGTPYTASGTYTYTHFDANGCTQVDTLHLTINNPVHLATTDTACEIYTWNGTTYTATGNYTYSHLDANGCTQVDTLHLTINYPVHLATTDTACETYTWNGTPYTTSGNYTYTHFDANGCTQVDTLHLTINYPVHVTTADTACETYTWNGTPYTASGTYTYTHLDAHGCTQVDTLHLTINNNSTSIETVTACNSYVWHGTEYFASTNTPTYTTTNAAGCDSVVTLHLTIIECSTTEITACDSYIWHGATYTSGGTYMDGTDTLVLTLNYSTSATETITACDSYTWHGTMFTTTGTVTDTLTNAAGCDSVTTLYLTVNYSNTGTETVTACNSYVWHGTEYTASTNTPTYTCTNAAGCDSVTTLHLTIIECSTTTITACDSYTWHDSTYTVSGIYTHGTDTLDLTINYSTTGDTMVIAYAPYDWYGTMLTATGTYIHTLTNAAGCDSVVTLHFRYPLYNTFWSGDTVVTYNAQPYCGLTASYTDDDNATLGTTLTYTNGTEVITSPNCPVNAGTYTVTARPMTSVDSLLGATTTLTILPATVSVSGAEAETAKFYDGTTDAIVTHSGTLTGIQGNDNLAHTVTAWFSSSEVGTGLTVTLGYAIDGTAAANYLLDPVESVYSTEGAILAPFLPDTTALTEDTLDGVRDGILVDANGYCAGEGKIEYTLATGSPDQYRLVFSDALFTDVDWRNLETPTGNNGVIYFDVPVGIPTGDYSVTLYFRDHNYPELVSNPVTVHFHINLPDTYMVVLFSDVIALIDTCQCITDVQWYRRAEGATTWTPIPGATGNYYCQEGGLEGWEFFVKCRYYGQETFVCPQTDLGTLVSDEATDIIAYPNPTTGQVTVRIERMTTINHEYTLLNMSGVVMEQGTFSGSSVTLDLSDYQRGSYMVSVDGMVVRIIRN